MSIGGYYYNEEYNRYFKIPAPGTFEYEGYATRKKKVFREDRGACEEKKKKGRGHFLRHLFELELGVRRRERSQIKDYLLCARHAGDRLPGVLDIDLGGVVEVLESTYMRYLESKRLFAVGTVEGSIFVYKMNGKFGSLKYSTSWSNAGRVTGIHFLKENLVSVSCIGSLVCGVGGVRLYDTRRNQLRYQSIPVGKRSIWCHEPIPHSSSIVVGATRSCSVYGLGMPLAFKGHVRTPSDVQAVLPHRYNESQLWIGMRNGGIRCWDSRCRNLCSDSSVMGHHSSICCMKWLAGCDYLMSSDLSGTIRQWDVRMQKFVKEWSYPNCCSRFSFTLDPSGQYLVCGGEDRMLYIFNILENKKNCLLTLGPFNCKIYQTCWARQAGRHPHGDDALILQELPHGYKLLTL